MEQNSDGANGQANGQANQPQLVLQKIYVKDVSFEVPNAPQIFQDVDENDQPQVQLNLGQKATDLGNDQYEVVLSLTLTCTVGQRTAYLAEVEQAGLFGIAGFNEMDQAGHHRQLLPEPAVSVCPPDDFLAGAGRRFPAVPAAADQLRCVVRRTAAPHDGR
jgi:protein-export chaperone SecB